jgi:hypothetical protein
MAGKLPRLATMVATAMVLAAAPLASVSAQPASSAQPAGSDTGAETYPNQPDLFDNGKLLETSGVTQLEGAGGGGLVPWALITGYGTENSLGGNVHYTVVRVPSFLLQSEGVAVGILDRVELSYAHEAFDTGSFGATLGIGKGFTFHEDVYGAKVKLFGDAIYAQDSLLPQVSAGIMYKTTDHADILHAIGARSANGVDYYLAATKVLLGESLLLDATVRMTQANQLGLLGFGGDRNNNYKPEFEGSIAYLLSRHVAIGAEIRTKPDNLRFAHEYNWYDAFLAVFINKHVSATVAFVSLGSIATSTPQNGVYFSLQIGL